MQYCYCFIAEGAAFPGKPNTKQSQWEQQYIVTAMVLLHIPIGLMNYLKSILIIHKRLDFEFVDY